MAQQMVIKQGEGVGSETTPSAARDPSAAWWQSLIY